MQFNSGNNIRASVAVTAGVWDNANNFIVVDDMPGCATVIANGTDPMSNNSTTWCTAQSSTLGLTNSPCDNMSNCPDDYANGGMPSSMPPLSGSQTADADFETDGVIISTQIIGPNITVDYDSGTEIELQLGFEVQLTTIFHAFIDGCNGLMISRIETSEN